MYKTNYFSIISVKTFGEKKYQNEPTERFKDKKRNKEEWIKGAH
jgi:hypothetical protein